MNPVSCHSLGDYYNGVAHNNRRNFFGRRPYRSGGARSTRFCPFERQHTTSVTIENDATHAGAAEPVCGKESPASAPVSSDTRISGQTAAVKCEAAARSCSAVSYEQDGLAYKTTYRAPHRSCSQRQSRECRSHRQSIDKSSSSSLVWDIRSNIAHSSSGSTESCRRQKIHPLRCCGRRIDAEVATAIQCLVRGRRRPTRRRSTLARTLGFLCILFTVVLLPQEHPSYIPVAYAQKKASASLSPLQTWNSGADVTDAFKVDQPTGKVDPRLMRRLRHKPGALALRVPRANAGKRRAVNDTFGIGDAEAAQCDVLSRRRCGRHSTAAQAQASVNRESDGKEKTGDELDGKETETSGTTREEIEECKQATTKSPHNEHLAEVDVEETRDHRRFQEPVRDAHAECKMKDSGLRESDEKFSSSLATVQELGGKPSLPEEESSKSNGRPQGSAASELQEPQPQRESREAAGGGKPTLHEGTQDMQPTIDKDPQKRIKMSADKRRQVGKAPSKRYKMRKKSRKRGAREKRDIEAGNGQKKKRDADEKKRNGDHISKQENMKETGREESQMALNSLSTGNTEDPFKSPEQQQSRGAQAEEHSGATKRALQRGDSAVDDQLKTLAAVRDLLTYEGAATPGNEVPASVAKEVAGLQRADAAGEDLQNSGLTRKGILAMQQEAAAAAEGYGEEQLATEGDAPYRKGTASAKDGQGHSVARKTNSEYIQQRQHSYRGETMVLQGRTADGVDSLEAGAGAHHSVFAAVEKRCTDLERGSMQKGERLAAAAIPVKGPSTLVEADFHVLTEIGAVAGKLRDNEVVAASSATEGRKMEKSDALEGRGVVYSTSNYAPNLIANDGKHPVETTGEQNVGHFAGRNKANTLKEESGEVDAGRKKHSGNKEEHRCYAANEKESRNNTTMPIAVVVSSATWTAADEAEIERRLRQQQKTEEKGIEAERPLRSKTKEVIVEEELGKQQETRSTAVKLNEESASPSVLDIDEGGSEGIEKEQRKSPQRVQADVKEEGRDVASNGAFSQEHSYVDGLPNIDARVAALTDTTGPLLKPPRAQVQTKRERAAMSEAVDSAKTSNTRVIQRPPHESPSATAEAVTEPTHTHAEASFLGARGARESVVTDAMIPGAKNTISQLRQNKRRQEAKNTKEELIHGKSAAARTFAALALRFNSAQEGVQRQSQSTGSVASVTPAAGEAAVMVATKNESKGTRQTPREDVEARHEKNIGRIDETSVFIEVSPAEKDAQNVSGHNDLPGKTIRPETVDEATPPTHLMEAIPLSEVETKENQKRLHEQTLQHGQQHKILESPSMAATKAGRLSSARNQSSTETLTSSSRNLTRERNLSREQEVPGGQQETEENLKQKQRMHKPQKTQKRKNMYATADQKNTKDLDLLPQKNTKGPDFSAELDTLKDERLFADDLSKDKKIQPKEHVKGGGYEAGTVHPRQQQETLQPSLLHISKHQPQALQLHQGDTQDQQRAQLQQPNPLTRSRHSALGGLKKHHQRLTEASHTHVLEDLDQHMQVNEITRNTLGDLVHHNQVSEGVHSIPRELGIQRQLNEATYDIVGKLENSKHPHKTPQKRVGELQDHQQEVQKGQKSRRVGKEPRALQKVPSQENTGKHLQLRSQEDVEKTPAALHMNATLERHEQQQQQEKKKKKTLTLRSHEGYLANQQGTHLLQTKKEKPQDLNWLLQEGKVQKHQDHIYLPEEVRDPQRVYVYPEKETQHEALYEGSEELKNMQGIHFLGRLEKQQEAQYHEPNMDKQHELRVQKKLQRLQEVQVLKRLVDQQKLLSQKDLKETRETHAPEESMKKLQSVRYTETEWEKPQDVHYLKRLLDKNHQLDTTQEEVNDPVRVQLAGKLEKDLDAQEDSWKPQGMHRFEAVGKEDRQLHTRDNLHNPLQLQVLKEVVEKRPYLDTQHDQNILQAPHFFGASEQEDQVDSQKKGVEKPLRVQFRGELGKNHRLSRMDPTELQRLPFLADLEQSLRSHSPENLGTPLDMHSEGELESSRDWPSLGKVGHPHTWSHYLEALNHSQEMHLGEDLNTPQTRHILQDMEKSHEVRFLKEWRSHHPVNSAQEEQNYQNLHGTLARELESTQERHHRVMHTEVGALQSWLPQERSSSFPQTKVEQRHKHQVQEELIKPQKLGPLIKEGGTPQNPHFVGKGIMQQTLRLQRQSVKRHQPLSSDEQKEKVNSQRDMGNQKDLAPEKKLKKPHSAHLREAREKQEKQSLQENLKEPHGVQTAEIMEKEPELPEQKKQKKPWMPQDAQLQAEVEKQKGLLAQAGHKKPHSVQLGRELEKQQQVELDKPYHMQLGGELKKQHEGASQGKKLNSSQNVQLGEVLEKQQETSSIQESVRKRESVQLLIERNKQQNPSSQDEEVSRTPYSWKSVKKEKQQSKSFFKEEQTTPDTVQPVREEKRQKKAASQEKQQKPQYAQLLEHLEKRQVVLLKEKPKTRRYLQLEGALKMHHGLPSQEELNKPQSRQLLKELEKPQRLNLLKEVERQEPLSHTAEEQQELRLQKGKIRQQDRSSLDKEPGKQQKLLYVENEMERQRSLRSTEQQGGNDQEKRDRQAELKSQEKKHENPQRIPSLKTQQIPHSSLQPSSEKQQQLQLLPKKERAPEQPLRLQKQNEQTRVETELETQSKVRQEGGQEEGSHAEALPVKYVESQSQHTSKEKQQLEKLQSPPVGQPQQLQEKQQRLPHQSERSAKRGEESLPRIRDALFVKKGIELRRRKSSALETTKTGRVTLLGRDEEIEEASCTKQDNTRNPNKRVKQNGVQSARTISPGQKTSATTKATGSIDSQGGSLHDSTQQIEVEAPLAASEEVKNSETTATTPSSYTLKETLKQQANYTLWRAARGKKGTSSGNENLREEMRGNEVLQGASLFDKYVGSPGSTSQASTDTRGLESSEALETEIEDLLQRTENSRHDDLRNEWLGVIDWTGFQSLIEAISRIVQRSRGGDPPPVASLSSTKTAWFLHTQEGHTRRRLIFLDDSCFERDVRYSPGSEFYAVWRGVPTATHCQILCRLSGPTCKFFSFVRSNLLPVSHQGACFLLPRKEPRIRVKPQSPFKVMSGPRWCSPPTVDESSMDLQSTKHSGCPSSPSVCEALNLPAPLGARFSPFCGEGSESGFCTILANGVPCCSLCNNTPDNLCPDLTCYEYNVDYNDGQELQFVASGVANRGACESLCREKKGCTHYIYVSSGYLPGHLGGSCALRRFTRPPKSRVYIEGVDEQGHRNRDAGLLATFAPLECDYPTTTTTTSTVAASHAAAEVPDCLKQNVNFWGFDLASLRNCPTVKICQEFCQQLDGCVAFTYVESQVRCYLKWKVAYELEAPDHASATRCCSPAEKDSLDSTMQTETSGRRHKRTEEATDPICPAPPKTNCIHPGIDFYGNDVREYTGVVTAYKCYIFCKEMKDCNVWTHLPAEKLCFLKNAKLGKDISVAEARRAILKQCIVQAGAVTGFGDCEPFSEAVLDELLVHGAHRRNVGDITRPSIAEAPQEEMHSSPS